MLRFEVVENNEVIAAFRSRDDAAAFIDNCGNGRMKIRFGKWVESKCAANRIYTT